MAKSAASRWLTTLLLAFVVSACDSEAPTATPAATSNTTQPTNTPAGIAQVENNTPTAGSTVGISGANTPTPVSGALVGTPPIGTPLPTLPSPTPEPPHSPSSFDKINSAVAAGKLDADTALLYDLYAHYLPDKLPVEYRGDDTGQFPEPTVLFTRLRERMGSLPAAVQAELQPFFLRPNNPKSFWYQAAAQQSNANPRGPGLASPATPDFQYVDTPHIRVWYDAAKSGHAEVAGHVQVEIIGSNMWNKEKRAMLGREPCSDASFPDNGGDGKLDLYVVDQTTVVSRTANYTTPVVGGRLEGNLGVTPPIGPVAIQGDPNGRYCFNASFILVDVALDDIDLRDTTAHELFHAFQFGFNRAPDSSGSDYSWWQEASATWAEDLVYPPDDKEQQRLPYNWAWRNYDGPLDAWVEGSSQQYASYLWAFYLRQVENNDETVVGRLWQASESKIPIEVMSSMADWNKRFKEFALWNWNVPPVDKYVDHGKHINPLIQKSVKGLVQLPDKPTYVADVFLPTVSVRYYEIFVSDWGPAGSNRFVNQVRFDFSKLTGQPPGVQSIVKLGDDPDNPRGYLVEDWSNLTEKTICREVTPVSSVVLVVSNSAIESRALTGPITVEALNTQCPKEASFTFNMDGEYSLDKTEPIQEKGNASVKQTLTSSWDIAFVGNRGIDTAQRTDINSYVFTATNTYEVHMSGNYVSTGNGGLDKVNASLTGGGIYNTHNPPLPDEDEYKYMSQYQGPNAAQALETRRGIIETYYKDGKYQSMIGFAPPPVALRYTVERHIARNCPPNESASYDEVTNESGVNAVANGSDDCLSFGPQLGSHRSTRDTPELFGPPSFTPDSRSPGSWQITPFDPATGMIEGNLDFTVTSCQQAQQVDTLNGFAWHSIGAAGQDGQGCNVTYHAHYRVKLPPKIGN